MEYYLGFVSRFAKTILVVLGLITIFFAWEIGFLTEDSNPYLLPETHPARKSILDMRKDFTGTYDSVLIAIYNQETIFNRSSLNAIFELTQQARRLMFTNESDVERLKFLKDKYAENPVLVAGIDGILVNGLAQNDGALARKLYREVDGNSLSTADYNYLRAFSERVDPIREMAGMAATENVLLDSDGTLRAYITVNNSDIDVKSARDAVLGNELMEMGVVDKTGNVGLVVVEISILQNDAEGQLRAYEAFKALVENYRQQHPEFKDEVFIGGVPVFFAEQKNIMDHDLGMLLPCVLVLVGLVLVFFFRSTLGVLIPIVNVVLCTIWTLGMMALTGVPLDLITGILPVFLITICSADAIHVMAEYYMQPQERLDNLESIKVTMRLMTSPVILTTLTTCLTFTLSTSTSISNLRNFGIFISFGLIVALVITLLMIPAWLSLLGRRPTAAIKARRSEESFFISRLLLRIFQPVTEKRPAFIVGFAIFIAVSAWFAANIYTDDMGSGYFAKNNTFRIADEFINDHIAGTSPGWIEIDTHRSDGALKLEMVQFVDKLEKFLHQQQNVTYSYSIAKYVRRINYVLNNHDPSYNRLPEAVETFTEVDNETGKSMIKIISGDDIVRQAILMFENGGGSDLTNVLNSNFSKTILLFTMNTTVASEYRALLDKLNPWIRENIPNGISYKLAGSPVIWTAVLDELLSDQLMSLVLSFVTVLVTMSVWFKSVRMGFVGTLPLAVTVLCYYAAMTLFGIELNIGTAITSYLVLGIVDYSAHYLVRIQIGLKSGLSLDTALLAAIAICGRSIMANVFVFSIGFIALLFSSFKPIVDLGALVGFSLFISGIMSLFVITLFAPWLVDQRGIRPPLR